ncbi:MAG TPA: TetR family transcriptional regulator [Candidatus Binataceae bacterium]|nr:TetR family transcriptional regulator [Candidatus Binataceae bacterium]
MAARRDLNRTRERILSAALAEFSANGLAGARTEAIARRARINKRMLYYCYGSKRELYAEVQRRKIAEKAQAIESTPEDFAEALLYLEDQVRRDLDWMRMLQWEALEASGAKLVAEAERRDLFRRVIAKLKRAQSHGAVPSGIDLSQLFISTIALTSFPFAFPQMTELVFGMSPTDPRFRRKHREFLRCLGGQLSAGPHLDRARTDRAPGAGPSEHSGAQANGRGRDAKGFDDAR